jgi:hypothetical protein
LYGTQVSLPFTQWPATGSCPEPAHPSHTHTQVPKIHFNIILSSILKSLMQSLTFMLSNWNTVCTSYHSQMCLEKFWPQIEPTKVCIQKLIHLITPIRIGSFLIMSYICSMHLFAINQKHTLEKKA